MRAGWTKLVLTVWLTSHVILAVAKSNWLLASGVAALLGFTALLAYQAGRGDEAWM